MILLAQLARLEALEARCREFEAAAEAACADAEAVRLDARASELENAEQRRQMHELGAALAAREAEVAQLQADRRETADVLLACLVTIRQEGAAAKARALLAGSAGSGSSPARQQHDSQTGAAQAAAAGGAEAGQPGPTQQPLQLLPASMRQRQAVLTRLLDKLQPGWEETEGLMLPPSGLPSVASFDPPAEANARLTAR